MAKNEIFQGIISTEVAKAKNILISNCTRAKSESNERIEHMRELGIESNSSFPQALDENLINAMYSYAALYAISRELKFSSLSKDSPCLQGYKAHTLGLMAKNGISVKNKDLSETRLCKAIFDAYRDLKLTELTEAGKQLGSFGNADPSIFSHYMGKALCFSDPLHYEHNRLVLTHAVQTAKQKWLGEDMRMPIMLVIYSRNQATGKTTMISGWGSFVGQYYKETNFERVAGITFNSDDAANYLAIGIAEGTEAIKKDAISFDKINNIIDGRPFRCERKGFDAEDLKPFAAIIVAANLIPFKNRARRNGVFYLIDYSWDIKVLETIEGLPKPTDWSEIFRNLFKYCPRPTGDWELSGHIAKMVRESEKGDDFFEFWFGEIRTHLTMQPRNSLNKILKLLRDAGMPPVSQDRLEQWFRTTENFVLTKRQRKSYSEWVITQEYLLQLCSSDEEVSSVLSNADIQAKKGRKGLALETKQAQEINAKITDLQIKKIKQEGVLESLQAEENIALSEKIRLVEEKICSISGEIALETSKLDQCCSTEEIVARSRKNHYDELHANISLIPPLPVKTSLSIAESPEHCLASTREIMTTLYGGLPFIAGFTVMKPDVVEKDHIIEQKYEYYCINRPKETKLISGLRSHANMATFNHFVFESDDLTMDQQKSILEMSKEIIALAVFSGGKSIHMHVITRQTFTSVQEYKAVYKIIADRLYSNEFANKYDPACCDPARWTRMPNSINSQTKNKQEVLHFDPEVIIEDDFTSLIQVVPLCTPRQKRTLSTEPNGTEYQSVEYVEKKNDVSFFLEHAKGNSGALQSAKDLLAGQYEKGKAHIVISKGLAKLYNFTVDRKYVFTEDFLVKIIDQYPRGDKIDTKQIMDYVFATGRK